MSRAVSLLLLASIPGLLACASTPLAEFSQAPQQSTVRKIVRTGDLDVSVSDTAVALREAERLVAEVDGFIEWSSVDTGKSVRLRARVPANELVTIMDALSGLGVEQYRSVSAADVTDEHADLSTRLANDISLRDRLRALLERATDVEEILAIEKELNRIQTEVESLQGRLDRLDSQIVLSELTVGLAREQILGPLGYVGYGLWWTLSKLFVLH